MKIDKALWILVSVTSCVAAYAAGRHSVTMVSLSFKETSIVGGTMEPAHLDITFAGTPGPNDVLRLRPENNDAKGWRTMEPLKGDFAFSHKDATGPYLDVHLTGTSPQDIAIDTSNPPKTREGTKLSGKLSNSKQPSSQQLFSSLITIVHPQGS